MCRVGIGCSLEVESVVVGAVVVSVWWTDRCLDCNWNRYRSVASVPSIVISAAAIGRVFVLADVHFSCPFATAWYILLCQYRITDVYPY